MFASDTMRLLKAIEITLVAFQQKPKKYLFDHSATIHAVRTASKLEEFFTWPISASFITMKTDMQCIAVLHDVEEYTDYDMREVESIFGKFVREGVHLLSNPSRAYPDLSQKKRLKMDIEHVSSLPEYLQIIKAFNRIDNLYDMIGANPKFVTEIYLPESIDLFKVLKVDKKIKELYQGAIEWLSSQINAEIFNHKNHKSS